MRTHRNLRTALAGAALAVTLVVLAAAPASAGVGPDGRERNRRIGVGGVAVAAGETVDGPLVGVDGRAEVAGTVDGTAIVIRGNLVVTADGVIDGDVLVVRGDARINGRVDGDVTVLSGRAVIGADAVVRGDVASTDEPRVARGARVTGDVDDIDIAGILASIGAGILIFWWIAVTVSTAVLGTLLLALFPRALEASAGVGRDPKRWWIALLVGLGLVIGLPIVGVVAVGSLLGLPLGLGVLGALGLLHALGYVAGAFFLGRCILKTPKNRFGAFFVGWAILRVLAVLPGLGVLVWIAAAVYGLGTLAVAAFRAGQQPRTPVSDTDPPTTPPAAPPAPVIEAPPAPEPATEAPGAPAEVTA